MVRKFFVDGSRFLNMGYNVMLKLIAEAKASKDLITLEATVATGFEFLAVEECREKCQPVNVFKCKGRIFFNIKKDSYPNVLKMRSLDNVFLVSNAYENMNFSRDKEQDVEKIASLVSKVDWARCVPEWAELVGYKGIQFPKCAKRRPDEPVDDTEPLCQSCLKAQDGENAAEAEVVQTNSGAEIVVPTNSGAEIVVPTNSGAEIVAPTNSGAEIDTPSQVPMAANDGLATLAAHVPEVAAPTDPDVTSVEGGSPDSKEFIPVPQIVIESPKDVLSETDDEAFHSAEEDCAEIEESGCVDKKELTSAVGTPAQEVRGIKAAQESEDEGIKAAKEPKDEGILIGKEPKEVTVEAAREPEGGGVLIEKERSKVGFEAAEEPSDVGILTDKEAIVKLEEPTTEKKLTINGQVDGMSEKTESTFKIFLKGFPQFARSEDLTLLFEKYGKVVECSVIKKRGRSAGSNVAFVHMENTEDGLEAIKHLNGQLFSGQPLYVAAGRNRAWPLPADGWKAAKNSGIEVAEKRENPPKERVEASQAAEKEGGRRGEKKKGHWQKLREEREFRAKQKENKRQPKPYVDDGILKFRVTCYRSGNRHSFESNDAAMHFGGLINDTFHWTVDLTRFDINVFLVIEDENVYVTFGLTKSSFHRRNISHFGPTTLRATMCYSMVRLAEPKVGEIVIDPLCGSGSISIEGAIGFPKTFHLCGDANGKCMDRTLGNLKFNNKEKTINVDAFQWNARRLPLKDQSVDVLVTDLPFGLRMGKWKDNGPLYIAVLTELARVVRCGSGRASLLTYDKSAMIKALRATGTLWREIRSESVNQGGLKSMVYLLLRRADTKNQKAVMEKLAMTANQETPEEARTGTEGVEFDEEQQVDAASGDLLGEAETKSLPDSGSDLVDPAEDFDEEKPDFSGNSKPTPH